MPSDLPEPTGLVNLTNTCFMNSAIQLVWRAVLDEIACESALDARPTEDRPWFGGTPSMQNNPFANLGDDDEVADNHSAANKSSISKKDKRSMKKADKASFEAAAATVAAGKKKTNSEEEKYAEEQPIAIVRSSPPPSQSLLDDFRGRVEEHLSSSSTASSLALLSQLFLCAPTSSGTSIYSSKAKARAVKGVLTQLKDKLAAQNERFMDWDQHDAHELAQCLLAVLHSELNRGQGMTKDNYRAIADVKKNETEDEAAERWLKHLLRRDNSLITDMFYFTTKTVTTCGHCNNKSYNFDSIGELQLNLTGDIKAITSAVSARRAASGDNNTGDRKAPLRPEEQRDEEVPSDAGVVEAAGEEGDGDRSDASSNVDSEDQQAETNKVPPMGDAHQSNTGNGQKKLTAKQLKAQEKADKKAKKETDRAAKVAKKAANSKSGGKDKAARTAKANEFNNKKNNKSSSSAAASSSWSSILTPISISLQTLLEYHLDTSETVEGYKCDRCQVTSSCVKRTTVISYPRYWFLLLTRFTPDGRKVKTPVSFAPPSEGTEGCSADAAVGCTDQVGSCYVDLIAPRSLLHPYRGASVTSDGEESPMGQRFDSTSSDANAVTDMRKVNRYEVVGTVTHHGSTLNFGHYTSNVKSVAGSDSGPTVVPIADGKGGKALHLLSADYCARRKVPDTASYGGQWYHCDDDDVESKNEPSAVLSRSGDAGVYLVLLKAIGNTYGDATRAESNGHARSRL